MALTPTVELLPVACIRQKMSGNRNSPREPANVNTRPTSSNRLTLTSINDRPSRQVFGQGYRAQERQQGDDQGGIDRGAAP